MNTTLALALISAISGSISILVYNLRVHVRDNRDREFYRHAFDQTRSEQALSDYAAIRSRRRPGDNRSP